MHQTPMECGYFTDLKHYKSSMKTDIIIPNTSIIFLHHQTGPSGAERTECSVETSLHGVLQLLIPEAENDRAKKGGEDCIGCGHQRVTVHRMGALGLEVDDGGKTVVHDHYGEVGYTGGEGLVSALSRGDPQYGSHNEDIEEDNEE